MVPPVFLLSGHGFLDVNIGMLLVDEIRSKCVSHMRRAKALLEAHQQSLIIMAQN